MTLFYADPQIEANVALKSRTVSGEEVPGHDVISLPGTVASDINASSSSLSTLVGYLATVVGTITSSRIAVDLTSTLTTYLSNLPTLATYLNTLQGAITAARMQVDLATTPTANLATLAGAITTARMAVNVDSTTTGKLDALHTDLATTLALLLNPGASVCGQTSSTNSSAAFGSQVCTLGVFVKNISTNGQKSYIFPGGTASASNGYELAIGEERWFPCANMSTLRHFSTAASANLCWEAI